MTILNEKRRLNTKGLGKNLYGKILKYPLDLENANGHYMIFNVFARTDKNRDLPATDLNVSNNQTQFYNNSFTRERFFDDTTNLSPAEGESGTSYKLIKDSLVLYMPDDVSVNYKSNYNAAEVGAVAGAFAGIADTLKGNQGIADLAKGQGMQAAKLIEGLVSFGSLGTAAGGMAALQRKTGLAPAPLQEMIFEGIDYRTFSYNFTMTPRNREEAREIKKIIDTFTYHMLPEKLGTGSALVFRVPSEFTIRYMYRGKENRYLNTVTFCALTDMKIDYGGGEKYVTYRPDEDGAPPVKTTVSLTFQELEYVDRKRAVYGTHDTRTQQEREDAERGEE